jgi:hypothetical protein
MGLAQGCHTVLGAAYEKHRCPQGAYRQRPIGDIYPRGSARGRADKAQKGERSAAEGDTNNRTPPEGACGQGYHGHMGNADDDPQWEGDIEEKHTEG